MKPLSRAFLLSRGWCCNFGCKNCPYKNMNKPNDYTIDDYYDRMRTRLLPYGYKFFFTINHENHVRQVYKGEYKGDDTEWLYSLYVKEQYRNKRLFPEIAANLKIVTVKSCGLEKYLAKNNINHVVCHDPWENEYSIIEKYYGDQRAKRSNVRYINHIDEGLGVLYKLGASDVAKAAFCLHPIYQGSITDNIQMIGKYEAQGDLQILIGSYADLYSIYANNLLRVNYQKNRSPQIQKEINEDKDLRNMLIADKIQNFKDFKIYHKKNHEYEEIEKYFLWWLDFLEVDRIIERELTGYIC